MKAELPVGDFLRQAAFLKRISEWVGYVSDRGGERSLLPAAVTAVPNRGSGSLPRPSHIHNVRRESHLDRAKRAFGMSDLGPDAGIQEVGNGDRGENTNDRDHNQQLDQSESMTSAVSTKGVAFFIGF